MGGAIANLYVQRYPKQVHSLAFIGSPLGVIGWADGIREALFQGINPFIPITKEQFDLEMSLLFVTPPAIPDSEKAEKVQDYITRNRHYQQVWDIVNLYDDVLRQKSPVQRPTLIIWGQDDRIYHIRGATWLQQNIPASQLIRLPGAGHLLLMENADGAASHYLNFLKTVRVRQPVEAR
jgi:pimeloyl-ACP methyl ester carboxylesterase